MHGRGQVSFGRSVSHVALAETVDDFKGSTSNIEVYHLHCTGIQHDDVVGIDVEVNISKPESSRFQQHPGKPAAKRTFKRGDGSSFNNYR